MKRFSITLLAAFTLPIAINAEVTNDYMLKRTEARKLYREGKFSEMKNICEELIEISPDNPMGYVCKGFALGFVPKSERKSREALKNFTKAIKINPEYNEAYFFRGLLQFQMRRRRNLGIARTACNDMSKAYFNNHPFALEYVKK